THGPPTSCRPRPICCASGPDVPSSTSTSSRTDPHPMTELVVVDLPDAFVRQIGARTGRVPRPATIDDLPGVVDDTTLAVVGAPVGGVALAQAVHDLAADVAVVLVAADVAEGNEVRATLSITPGIGR